MSLNISFKLVKSFRLVDLNVRLEKPILLTSLFHKGIHNARIS